MGSIFILAHSSGTMDYSSCFRSVYWLAGMTTTGLRLLPLFFYIQYIIYIVCRRIHVCRRIEVQNNTELDKHTHTLHLLDSLVLHYTGLFEITVVSVNTKQLPTIPHLQYITGQKHDAKWSCAGCADTFCKGCQGKGDGEQQQACKHFLNGQTRFKPRWAKILKIITKTYLSLCPSLVCISDAAPPPLH